MFQVLQILSITLVAVGMSLSLAHALELPGKLRLERETYLAVQTIYYPGFTIGGLFGEFGAMLATLVLLLFTPIGTSSFWITLIALAALLAAHGVYWVVTHPVNQVWLKGQDIHRAGATFFAVGGKGNETAVQNQEWTVLRARWEYSHVARAVLAMLSFVLLVIDAVV